MTRVLDNISYFKNCRPTGNTELPARHAMQDQRTVH